MTLQPTSICAPVAMFSPMTTFAASSFVNAAAAALLLIVFGGRRRLQAGAGVIAAVNVPHVAIARPVTGAQIFGDSKALAENGRIAAACAGRASLPPRQSRPLIR
jgi:hypothetical protein